MTGLNLISVNVRGIRNNDKRRNIFEWVRRKRGNVVLLQETYSTPDIEDSWKRDWGGQMYFSHGTNHSKGVLVLLAPGLNINMDQVKKDEDGRYVFIKGDILGHTLLLGSVYFPTRENVQRQVDFLDKIDNCISDLYSDNYSLILGGDFNLILNEKLDYMGSARIFRSNFTKQLVVFLRKYDLIDIWRKRNPGTRNYTFRQRTPLVQSRLDYWFISSQMERLVGTCDIMTSITPDHSGISIEFRQIKSEDQFGKSYWKFNSSLCLDKHFVEGMCNEIKSIKRQWENKFDTKSLFWDFLKMKMRQYARKFSKEKAKDRKNIIGRLENEIKLLENELIVSNIRVDIIEEKKNQLKKLYDNSLEGLKVRSRAVWYEEGEKNKDYFEQLLKSNKKKTIISELHNEKDELIRDKREVSHIIRKFYEKLYSEQQMEDDNVESFFGKDLPKLSDESRELCEGKITLDECCEVLKTMKTNKSPGNDGFTVEFYMTFWPHLGGILVDALNESYDKGNLSPSQKQGVITVIEKEGKNPLYIKNYRPITLLNVDYKILSKILAKRMKGVLNELVHSDQVGYMKNRNIGEALRLIDDMIFHCLKYKQDINLIAVDFEKAFDSISHSFLFKVLRMLGFGPSFCSWVEILYTDISSCVMNGGLSTGYFDIKRGVRQGDPLSPYLFLVVIEILSHALRKDDTIKGVNFGDFEVRQVLYADDMTIFVKNGESIRRLQNIFHAFWKVSGLKVNMEKTNVMWIGKDTEGLEETQFGNTVKEIKILGIYFTLDPQVKEELNYKEILSKIKRLLGWWKQRDLTIIGKIHLLKTYALSKLNYVSSALAVPKWLIAEIKKICFDFIWSGKDRIKRAIMYQDYRDGGLRMTDFELFVRTQRVMWLKRLLYGEQKMGWKLYFDYSFRSVGGRFIFLCNYDMKKLSLKVPLFYLEILRAWQDMESCRHFEEGKINPIFFNNKDFLFKGKMIYNETLYISKTFATWIKFLISRILNPLLIFRV